MALRTTPTIAICLAAGIAAGVALARPGNDPAPVAASPAAETVAADEPGDPDSPYLADGTTPAAGGADAATPPAAPAPIEISIEGFAFSSIDAVAGGSSIAVTNLDGAEHTLTATNGEFDTGSLGQNETVSIVVPSTPGTYEFFCEIHPSMTGQLVVS